MNENLFRMDASHLRAYRSLVGAMDVPHLPTNLADVTRILCIDEMSNSGESTVVEGREYPERQIIRVFAEYSRDGKRGVICLALDRLNGTRAWWFGQQGSNRVIEQPTHPNAPIFSDEDFVRQLLLMRLCALVDQDPALRMYYTCFAEAWLRPEGTGFQKLAREDGLELVDEHRSARVVERPGAPAEFVENAWYARGHASTDPCDTSLKITICPIRTHLDTGRTLFWGDETVALICENFGYGRMRPEPRLGRGFVWLQKHDSFFRLSDERADRLLRYFARPPSAEETRKKLLDLLLAP